jgi:hypothetical protein
MVASGLCVWNQEWRKAVPQFEGFTKNDFQDAVSGTTWRRGEHLGGVLAGSMSQATGQEYKSLDVPRRPELFIAPAEYLKDDALPHGKFFIRARSTGLDFGFYVEKGYTDGSSGRKPREVMNATWDWPAFVEALQRPDLNARLQDLVLHQGYLLGDSEGSIGIYAGDSRGKLSVLNPKTLAPTGQVVDWETIITKIVSAPADTWVNLHVMRRLGSADAIQRKAAIAQDILQVFQELLPIFEASRSNRSAGSNAVREQPDPYAPAVASNIANRVARHIWSTRQLHFTPLQIATFITALQTKGFVILSGISGTGKTKLAQEFARLLQSEDEEPNTLFLSVRPDWRDNKSLLGYYNPLTERYQTTELLRFILRARQEDAPHLSTLTSWVKKRFEDPDTQEWLRQFRELRQRLAHKALDSLTAEDLNIIWNQRANGVSGIGQAASHAVPPDRIAAATEIALDFQRTPAQRYWDIVQALGGATNGMRHWARAWRAVAAFDPEHVHTVVHGSRVKQLLEHLEYPEPADPRSLAQRNRIGEIDQATRFLFDKVDAYLPGLDVLERSIAPWLLYEFFEQNGPEATSTDTPVSPFFVFFDEMNLARVEYYFAEFLSVLEGGREKSGFTTEAIRLHEFEQPVLDPADVQVPPEIWLPPNIYFVGTVNVDETTHLFSPKVLDRAFTQEFSGADLSGYLSEVVEGVPSLDETDRLQLAAAFSRVGQYAQIDKQRILRFCGQHPDYMDQLRNLEARLRPYDLHFGYRVVDEILMFLVNAEDFRWFGPSSGDLAVAFDQAVTMKVLPKFHGPRSHLEDALWSVLEWAGLPAVARQSFNVTLSANVSQAFVELAQVSGHGHLQAVCQKCIRMMRSLYSTGFAAFS